MKKIYRLLNLECANCAGKMERAIKKIDGVNSATVSFMTSRLTIDAEDSRFDEIIEQCQKAIKKFERDCTIVK